MNDITEDDMRAMAQQGDRREFLRSLIRPLRKNTDTPPDHDPQPAGHRPGTWPLGTHPPGPPPPQPPGAWDAAVAEYRGLTPAERKKSGTCDCGCQTTTDADRPTVAPTKD